MLVAPLSSIAPHLTSHIEMLGGRASRWARGRRGALAMLSALSLTAGCARHTGPAESEREVVYRAESTIAVKIVNRSQLDAILYVVHDGTRDRLGAVTAASSASFTLRVRSLGAGGEFSLLADPVGSMRTTSTEILRANQGSVFTWTLETDFSRGSVLVRD
jgi:hypothetical protein